MYQVWKHYRSKFKKNENQVFIFFSLLHVNLLCQCNVLFFSQQKSLFTFNLRMWFSIILLFFAPWTLLITFSFSFSIYHVLAASRTQVSFLSLFYLYHCFPTRIPGKLLFRDIFDKTDISHRMLSNYVF